MTPIKISGAINIITARKSTPQTALKVAPTTIAIMEIPIIALRPSLIRAMKPRLGISPR